MDSNRETRDESTGSESKLRERVSALERLNAELSAREERFSRIFENAAEAIVVVQDGMIKICNPVATEILGRGMDALLSTEFSELIHPDDRSMVGERQSNHAREEHGGSACSVRFLTESGETRRIEARCAHMEWGGRPALLGLLTDVTTRDQVQTALGDSETRYSSLFNQANDAIFIMRGDMFVDCNEKTLEMFGCTREQIIGHPPYGFSPPQQRDGRDSQEAAIKKITAALAGAPQRFEWLHSRYDGTTFDAEVSLSCIEIGGETLVQAFVRDNSARKWLERIQEAMLQISKTAHTARTLEDLFRAIREGLSEFMDTTNFYVALYDDASNTYRFECFYDEHDEIDLHVAQDGDGSLTDHVRRTGSPLLVTASDAEEFRKQEGVSGGGTPSKSWLGVPLATQHGIMGVAAVQSYDNESAFRQRELDLMSFVAENMGTAVERLREEEEKESLERQVQQAQRLESLGVLAGGIAHDFNNLLTGIMGNADLALLDLPRSSSAADALHEIRSISQRASELCRQMLAYSGQATCAPEPLDLASEIQKMRNALAPLVPGTAALSIETLPSGSVNADRSQLAQIVRALVANAAEALGEAPGIVTIRTGTMPSSCAGLPASMRALADGEACPFVEVRDTGCGMDVETQRRVFEPFFSTKFTGRGLGLPAVQGIVRMHGGSVTVRSTPGKGTAVRVVLPPTQTEQDVAGKLAPPPADAAHTTEHPHVLFVDDEDVVRKVGETLLDRAGYSVTTAADGRGAVEYFKRHADEIACVVLDLSMPDMDGEAVFRELREVRPDMPILISSGYSGSDVTQRFEGLEHWAFLQKPFSSDSLISQVSRMTACTDPPQ